MLYRPIQQCASAVCALSALCLAALLLCASPPVHAAPAVDTRIDAPAPANAGSDLDPVTQLLLERGLLPARGAEMVEAVRHRASEMVLAAMNFLGVPYVRGGNWPVVSACAVFILGVLLRAFLRTLRGRRKALC